MTADHSIVRRSNNHGMARRDQGMLDDVNRQLRQELDAPCTYRIPSGTVSGPTYGWSDLLTWSGTGAISDNKSLLALCHIIRSRPSGCLAVQIDIIETAKKRKVDEFVFEEGAKIIERPLFSGGRRSVDRRINLQAICLINNSLALGLETGHMLIVLPDRSIHRCKLGGSIADMCRQDGRVAVSVFPDETVESIPCCGVKVFSQSEVLRGEFKPEQIISPEELAHGTPHCIRLIPNSGCLIASVSSSNKKGATSKVLGYYTRSPSFPPTLIYQQQVEGHHSAFMCSLSECTSDGVFAVTGSGRNLVTVYRHMEPIWSAPRPEALRDLTVLAGISPDGQSVFLLEGKGALYRVSPHSSSPEALMPRAWVLYCQPLSDDELLACVLDGDRYQVVSIPLSARRTKTKSVAARPREIKSHIMTQAYDVTTSGLLAVADSEGYLRIFKQDLSSSHAIKIKQGPLRQVIADPTRPDRLLLASCSGAAMTNVLNGEAETYIALKNNMPLEEGIHGICPSNRIESPLFYGREPGLTMSYFCTTLEPHGMVSRTLSVDLARPNIVRIQDYHWPNCSWSYIVNFTVNGSIGAVTLFDKKRAILALNDGRIIALDPHGIAEERWKKQRRKRILKPGPFCAYSQIPKMINPLGICCAMSSQRRIAVWTDKSMIVAKLDADYRVIESEIVALPDIRFVRYDAEHERLVVAFNDHLSFHLLDEPATARYRLYLIVGGKHLLHVLYPSALRRGPKENHPGFFYTDYPQYEELFQVVSAQGNEIVDPDKKRQFLADFQSKRLVSRAVRDYSAFCHGLAYPSRPAIQSRILLPNLRNVDGT